MNGRIEIGAPALSDAQHIQPVERAGMYILQPAPSSLHSLARWFLRGVFVLSVMVNLLILLLIWLWLSAGSAKDLEEQFYSGDASAADKVAVIRIDGVLLEGFTSYAREQLKQAAEDKAIKAVVVAVNSPGGSVTASDQLHKQIKDLREGKAANQNGQKKPVVVAMESVAASGGYYLAVPADMIFAQPTTITGSIGVYAPFFDLSRVPEKYGIDMKTLFRGDLKGASLFKPMSPQEEQHWNEMLDHTYQRFMAVVSEGRGRRLKHPLLDSLPEWDGKKLANGDAFVRRLADGGVFTAEQAKKYGLVDEIGYLDDAISHAKRLAQLDQTNVITYREPVTLGRALLGIKANPPEPGMALQYLPGATARLWYLAPGYELAMLKAP